MNNHLFCCPGKRVLFLSATYAGSMQDKAMCDEEAYAFPEGTVLDQDAGYKAISPLACTCASPPRNHGARSEQPSKKRRIRPIAANACW